MKPLDSYSTAKEISNYVSDNPFDLIIAGKESSDYNGGAVPGIIADMLNIPFVNACNGLEIEGNEVTLNREIDGGIEKIKASLPIIIGGQKGLVEESELRIPNMRGIMTARSKPLNIVEANNPKTMSKSIQFEKPAAKGECKMVSSDNIDQLVNMLQNEAKVI